MKIMFVCAGGYSTEILKRKLEKYCLTNTVPVSMDAVGKSDIEDQWKEYDCILLAPQISYCLDEIRASVRIPAAAIPALDYGLGNIENVLQLAYSITKDKGGTI